MNLQSLPSFHNEPFTDFSPSGTRRAMGDALEQVRSELNHSYPHILGGHRVREGQPFASINPARPAETVGMHWSGDAALAGRAVEAARQAFVPWSQTSAAERAGLLLRSAELVRAQHLSLCAWLTFEVGKNWVEADADVGECIDFLEFYARQALQLDAATTPLQYPGERNQLRYLPLGVGAVIPPWNFPLAITAGMTAAAIVTGNTVVVKPSPDAPTIAFRFVEILEQAGVPAGVVNLLQGGPDAGQALVEHPEVAFVAFTGSKKVGLEIHERAAKTQPGQRQIRRTILEMGGKDAIIVSADADLDAALDGVTASAFGFNGQKCSACSRAIVEDPVYEIFCDRMRDRVSSLRVGDPAQNSFAGPVINKAAVDRILDYIEIGKSEGRLLNGGGLVEAEDAGYFIAPTVFADIRPSSRLAQEEIFGPLLCVMRASSFEEALQMANDTEYGLTGALYSSSRAKLERAKVSFQVGNLYLNRKCTGAMVGAHPFGGFGMSGTDSKAGGPDYLLLFTRAKSIADKLSSVSEEVEEQEERMGL